MYVMVIMIVIVQGFQIELSQTVRVNVVEMQCLMNVVYVMVKE